jgi:hypothetical protein
MKLRQPITLPLLFIVSWSSDYKYAIALTHCGRYRSFGSRKTFNIRRYDAIHDVTPRTKFVPSLYTTSNDEGVPLSPISPPGSQDFMESTQRIPIVKHIRRIGGRRKQLRSRQQNRFTVELKASINNALSSIINAYGKLLLCLASASLLWVLFLSRLFTSNTSTPTYVYYQSSVIESQMIKSDGNIERSRTETFKSNLPDLVRQKQQQRIEQNSKDNDVTIQRQSISNERDEFQIEDEQIRRSLDALIKEERKLLLDNFF